MKSLGEDPAPLGYSLLCDPMLKDRLYRIDEKEGSEGEHRFRIALDPKDPIFEGHFPDQPVLPGACMMEIGRELLGEIHGRSFDLVHAKNMKIPAMVDPRESPELTIEMSHQEKEAGKVHLKYSVSHEEKVFFKFTGTYRASGKGAAS